MLLYTLEQLTVAKAPAGRGSVQGRLFPGGLREGGGGVVGTTTVDGPSFSGASIAPRAWSVGPLVSLYAPPLST